MAKFPLPILAIVKILDETNDPIARFIQLGNLFEVILRFLSTLTMGSYFHVQVKRPVDIPPRVFAGLKRPSLGHWCQLLHSIPVRLEEAGFLPVPEIMVLADKVDQPHELINAFRDIQFFLGKKREGVPKRFSIYAFFDLLVAFRNKTKAHGAIQGCLVERLNPVLEASLRTIMKKLSFLSEYPLGVISDQTLSTTSKVFYTETQCPAEGNLWVLDKNSAPVFSLFPAALWRKNDFWFLNGWESGSSVEYLNYATGHIDQITVEQIDVFFGNKPEKPVSFFDPPICVEVTRQDVWNLAVDIAIMAQDCHRVFGPTLDVQSIQEPNQQILSAIEELDKPNHNEVQGNVILTSRPWCRARFLLETVVYDLDQAIITGTQAVELGLRNALILSADFGPHSIALAPLGTEYGVISYDEFVDVLIRVLKEQNTAFQTVGRLLFAVGDESRVKPLQEALSRRLGFAV